MSKRVGRRRVKFVKDFDFGGSKTETIRKRVSRISTLNNKIKSLQREQELKFLDTLISQAMTSAGTVHLLNSLAQGSTVTSRVGSEVQATSLQFRGRVQTDALINTPVYVRFIVVWDAEAGVNPVVAGSSIAAALAEAILENSVVTDLTLAPFQYASRNRFRILYDKRFVLNEMVATESVGIQFKKKIKLSRIVKYGSQIAGIGGIVSNALFLVAITNVGANTPTMNIGLRFYFKDS